MTPSQSRAITAMIFPHQYEQGQTMNTLQAAQAIIAAEFGTTDCWFVPEANDLFDDMAVMLCNPSGQVLALPEHPGMSRVQAKANARFLVAARQSPDVCYALIRAVEVIEKEIEILSTGSSGSTHWAGCEKSHPKCAAIIRVRNFLIEINEEKP
jgi:hypothetical protein